MTLAADLAKLEYSGLIHLALVEPELEYLFRHALLHDAAYDSLLKADQRKLHLSVGQTLEELYPKRLSELSFVLAHHFSAAGETDQARKYFSQAGDNELARYANSEAERHYQAGLALGGSEAERAHLFAGLGDALNAQARFEEAAQAIHESSGLYRASGDDDTAARLYARASEAKFQSGDAAGALALCREGLAIPELANLADTRGLAELLHQTGKASFFNGLPDEARPLCERALSLAERLGAVDLQVNTLATLGILPDQSDEAKTQVLRRAVALAEEAGLGGLPAIRARNNLAGLLSREGDFVTTHQLQRWILEMAQQTGQIGREIAALTEMMYCDLQLGELEAADEDLASVRRLLTGVASIRIGPEVSAFEAMLVYYRGDTVEAIRALKAAWDEANKIGEIEAIIWMNNLLAEAYLEVEAADRAVSALLAALTHSQRLNYEADNAKSLCLLCVARVREGDVTDARRRLDEAQAKIGQQAAPLSRAWLALAEAHLATTEGQWTAAFAAFERKAQLEEQMSRRWYHAQTLREWAEAHLKRNEPGDVARARELLQKAVSEFEAMNAPKYAALAGNRLQAI